MKYGDSILATELLDIVRTLMGELFKRDPETIDSATTMESVEAWDSLQHLNLILALEESLDVRFATDEVTNMRSFDQIVSVLRQHYRQASK